MRRGLWGRGVALVISITLAAGLSACFSSPVTGQSERTLNDFLKSLPAGYEAAGTTGGGCGIDYCNFNKRFTMGNISTGSIASECRKLIDWATSIGANTWYHDSDYIPFPLQGYESNAIIACTMSEGSEIPTGGGGDSMNVPITANYVGTTSTVMFGLRGIYSGNDQKSPFDINFNNTREPRGPTDPIARRWNVELSTTYGDEDPRFSGTDAPTWDEAFAAVSPDSHTLNEILNAVGHYRVTHPQADPYAASTISAALAGLPQTTTYSLPRMANGSVHYIFVTSTKDFVKKDGGLCMSLKAFDSQLMEVPDPGTGYTHFTITGFAQDNRFGYWVPGKCPTK